jgi:predicted nucleic acid-binding protein
MQKIIVIDTSCLILLHKIGRISLLKSLFGRVYTSSVVAKEYGNTLPDFINVINAKDKTYQKILENFLDAGEASIIALALEKENSLLIIDETKGRKEAKKLKLNLTGTIGLLITAKEKGLLDSVSNIFDDINKTDFRISNDLINEAKRRCKE